MSITTPTASEHSLRHATTAAARPESAMPRPPPLLRLLNALAAADRRYREAQNLRRLPDERLKDMGLTRQQAVRAFRRQQG